METPRSPVPSPFASTLRVAFRSRGFMVACVILFLAAIGLNGTVNALKLSFRKERVEPRLPLASLPAVMGSWVQANVDESISHDMLVTLGTESDKYLFRTYVDTARLDQPKPDAVLKMLSGLSTAERAEKLAAWMRQRPSAVVTLGFTYYTGSADTVAHVPEICYVADGYQTDQANNEVWNLKGRSVPVRSLVFESATGLRSSTRSVAYLFHVNGRFESSSLAVRAALQNLFERRAYYAKVELMSASPDREEATRSMRQFLADAIPHLEKVLPDSAAMIPQAR